MLILGKKSSADAHNWYKQFDWNFVAAQAGKVWRILLLKFINPRTFTLKSGPSAGDDDGGEK